jgi:predicted DNA-binding protein YlxM (UPF0122 family)
LTAGNESLKIAQVIHLEKIVKQGILYDFYGALLTDHQRRVYEDVVMNDMSLAEIAEEQGVTRQAVHDMIRRCDRILEDYEARLGLVAKFEEKKELAAEVKSLAGKCRETGDLSITDRIIRIADRIADLG